MKRKIYLLVSILMLSLAAFNAKAGSLEPKTLDKETIANMTEEQKQARIQEIKGRVEEIRAMDKSKMNKTERKELRAELKGMRKEAQALGAGGIYLSLGAVIVIIVVLILIL